jgi:mRNA interferase MazF
MKRGEVWWVHFRPSIGGEIRKTRSAVIVSNDAANQYLKRIQVVPLSTKTEKLYPCEAYVTIGAQVSKAMADQLATVSKQRLRDKPAALSPEDMIGVEHIIRVQLGLVSSGPLYALDRSGQHQPRKQARISASIRG